MNFDQILLRLKQQLGVATDKEVAAQLGMTKTAFAERKRRNAFPEAELAVLVGKNPKLDMSYIMGGRTSDVEAARIIKELLSTPTMNAEETSLFLDKLTGDSDEKRAERRRNDISEGFEALTEADKQLVESLIRRLRHKS